MDDQNASNAFRQTKTCPHCDEQIPLSATMCEFCMERVQPVLEGQDQHTAINSRSEACQAQQTAGSPAKALSVGKLKTIHWIGIGVFLALMTIGAIVALVSSSEGNGSATSAVKGKTENKNQAKYKRFFSACSTGDGEACNRIATSYEKGDSDANIPIDLAKARHFYQRACDLKQRLGCVWAAELYEREINGKQFLEKAWAAYKKACEMGEGTGCDKLAAMTIGNAGVKPGTFDLRMFFSKLCGGKVAAGCFHLGVAHMEGHHGGIDLQKAFTLFNKGCSLKDASSCLNTAAFLYSGKLGRKDHKRARVFYRKGCELRSYPACRELGAMLFNGLGGDKNDKEAAKLLSRACRAGDKRSCRGLKIVKRQMKNAWQKMYPDCMRIEKLFNQCARRISALVQAKVAIHYKLGGKKWGKKALKVQEQWVEFLRKLCYRWRRFYSKKLNLKGGPRKYRDEWERGFWRRQDRKNLSKLQSLLPATDCDSLVQRIEPLLLK